MVCVALILKNKNKFVSPKTRLQRVVNNSFYGQCVGFYNRIPVNVQNATITNLKEMRKYVCVLKVIIE